MSNTPTAEKIAERALPEAFAVVFSAGGWNALREFAKVFGGKRIRIPRYKVGDHHPLVVAVGRFAADALVEKFGGDSRFHVPRGGHSLKLLAVQHILHLSDNEIAGRLGCTYRHAHNLAKEARSGQPKWKRRAGRPKAANDTRQIDIEEFLQTRR
jgi:hypothetical protein